MKKCLFLIWAVILYLLVCIVDMILYKVPIIPHYGFEKYSISEMAILYALTCISMIITVFALKRNRFISFVIAAVIFWIVYWVLNDLIKIPYLLSVYVSGYETFAFGVNWLRDNIWFYHDVGCFVGTIIAGIISLYKHRRLNRMNLRDEEHENGMN